MKFILEIAVCPDILTSSCFFRKGSFREIENRKKERGREKRRRREGGRGKKSGKDIAFMWNGNKYI
jgi:hypothetical protein